MNRHGLPDPKNVSDLSCCEYIDLNGEQRSCFQCLCGCDALDNACENCIACNYSFSEIDTGK